MVKTRTTLSSFGECDYWQGPYASPVTHTRRPMLTTNVDKLITSLGHKFPAKAYVLPHNGKLVVPDAGGSFLQQSIKQTMIMDKVDIRANFSDTAVTQRGYRGNVSVYDSNRSATFLSPSSNAALDAFGTTKIARVLPTNPNVGMGVFLGELREGLPKSILFSNWKKIAREARQLHRAGSREYLSAQFGYLPMIRDMRKFAHTVVNSETIVRQYLRDSGNTIRRRTRPETETSTVVTNLTDAYPYPIGDGYLQVSPGKLTRTVTTERTRWFSGAFTYYVESGTTVPDQRRRAEQLRNRLYGIRISPELVWNLAPWSWAVDWVSNMGDVIHNMSAFANDGLVMRYGYVMETVRETTVWSLAGAKVGSNKGTQTVSCMHILERVTKSRRRATPYGFGLSESSFTARQWSLIAALGISRAPRSLNF